MLLQFILQLHRDHQGSRAGTWSPGSKFFFFHAFKNSKMAETDVLEVEVDDRADFTEDTGEGTF
jgi:hypothetical protein